MEKINVVAAIIIKRINILLLREIKINILVGFMNSLEVNRMIMKLTGNNYREIRRIDVYVCVGKKLGEEHYRDENQCSSSLFFVLL